MIDATRLPLVYSFLHYAVAAARRARLVAGRGLFPGAQGLARCIPVDIIRGAT